MDVLLRELQSGADGIAQYHDVEFAGNEIVIGSAADSVIQLLGAGVEARHAIIRHAADRIELRCVRGCRARVNGQDNAVALLTIGDTIEIAGNRLAITKAPTGFDFAVEIRTDPNVDSSQFEKAFRTDLGQAWFSKRRLAWLALLIVVAIGFAIPLAGVWVRGEQTVAPAWLPSDNLWSTGALIPAHAQAAGDRCNHCHQALFVPVRDAACGQCHERIANHVGTEHAALIGLAAPQRCATCHREHGESAADIIVRADKVCTACHADAQTRFAALKMPNAKAFEPDEHPRFAANLLTPKVVAAGLVSWEASKTLLKGAIEQSNLKFSHRQHLDANKVVRMSDSAALNCNDCHKLNADGEHFTPLTMQSTCSGCHELNFDPTAPERQLAHGKPREAILALQEYFARKYTDPIAAPVVREKRRLPGRETESIACTDSALSCARQMAMAEIEMQFTRRGCVTCHAVSDTQNPDIYERFQVLPVRLSQDFFAGTSFNHRAHSIQKDKTGDAACQSCHLVGQSEKSSDLALPDSGQCMDCHRTHPAREQIVSHCVDCHGYHPRHNDLEPGSSNRTANEQPPVPPAPLNE